MSNSAKTGSDETSDFKYYLPGSPTESPETGRLRRYVGKLLRRRGNLIPVVRRRSN